MSPLLAFLPILIVYIVVRAVMHYRAGRRNWCIQYVIIAGFLTCVFAFECWMHF
jgi:hypothetical protein